MAESKGIRYATEEEMKYYWEAASKLEQGLCPNCKIPLIRGKTFLEKMQNKFKRIQYCPKCGHTLAGK